MAGEVSIVSVPVPPYSGTYLGGFTCEIAEVKQHFAGRAVE
jgi:hypothetical protein